MLVLLMQVLDVALIDDSSSAEVRKRDGGINVDVLLDLRSHTLPLRIAVDQQSYLVLFLLGLLGIFLNHYGISSSIDAVYHAKIAQQLISGLLIHLHLASHLFYQRL